VKLNLCVVSVFLMISATIVLPQSKTPTETKNAALRYWMAFAEMQDPPADKATQDLLAKTAAGEVAWDEKKLGSILDANEVAIRICSAPQNFQTAIGDWNTTKARALRSRMHPGPARWHA